MASVAEDNAVVTDHCPIASLPDDLLVDVFHCLVPISHLSSASSNQQNPPTASSSATSSNTSSPSQASFPFVSRRWLRLAYVATTSFRLTRRPGISASQLLCAVSRMPRLESLWIDDDRVWTSLALEAVFQGCTRLKELVLDCPPAITEFPSSVTNLAGLLRLIMSSEGSNFSLPKDIGKLHALRVLYLAVRRLTVLPESLGNLGNLQELKLNGCWGLSAIPETIGRLLKLRVFHAWGCGTLLFLPDALFSCTSLELLELFTPNLARLPESIGQSHSLRRLIVRNRFRGIQLPASFTRLSSLEELKLGSCLQELPEGFGNLTNLKGLELSRCPRLTLPSSLPQLSLLERLEIKGQQMVSLPETIGQLPALRELRISSFSNLQTLPNSIGQLQQLRSLTLRKCSSLRVLPESLLQLSALERLEFFSLHTLLPP
ncbi:hypothetical protein CLOP_g42 [Closterium sp. NIES-67]|nr:hypothetical protein CLOP_g42 [Closterium sp. NIES-67]